MTIRELWRKLVGEPDYVIQLRNLVEADALCFRLDRERLEDRIREERDRYTTELSVLREQNDEKIAEILERNRRELAKTQESADYFRQRMERFELLLHPGLEPRDPKAPRAPVNVVTGPRRKTWAQIQAEHATEEFDPDKVKADAEKDKVRREDIATRAQAAIDKAKADRVRKYAGEVEAQQEITLEEDLNV
jgi:hypothetical protein